MPDPRRRGDTLTHKLLAGIILALVVGAFSAYTDSIRRDEKLTALIEDVQELKTEVIKLRDAAHTHERSVRMFLPDAEIPE